MHAQQAGDEPGAFSVLVVCTANICRSPMAEYLLRRSLRVRPARDPVMSFVVTSAGVRGWSGAEMDPPAAAELRRLGEDPTGFRARALTDAYTESADLILTATRDHRAVVLQGVPSALRRTFTLLEFAHLVAEVDSVRAEAGLPGELVRAAATARGAASAVGYDLVDPYGGPRGLHRQVAELVSDATTAVADALLGGTKN